MKAFLKKHYLKILIGCLVITAGALLLPQVSSAEAAQSFSKDDWVLFIFGNLFLKIINALAAYILLPLINLVVQIFSYNGFLTSHAVQVGWPLVRDLCNMFFVVILLLIAFSTILHYKAYEYKEALPRLILMAIVINFSKTIMGLLIDFGQVLMLTFVNAFQGSMANNLVNAFGLTEMLKINLATGAQTVIGDGEIFASLFLALVLLVVAIGVMLAFAAVLLYRILVLWVLVILSPIAFFLSAFEAGEHYAKEFWEKFWSQLTTGAIMAFFMWLALTIISASYTDPAQKLPNQVGLDSAVTPTSGQIQTVIGEAKDGATGIASWDKFYTFVIAIALLLMALEFAEKAGGFAGKFAGAVAGKLEGMAVGHSGPLKRFRTAFEAYSKAKDQRHHEKYSAWGLKAAELHGGIQSKIGEYAGKPFAAARAGIARVTGFKQFEEESKKTKEKQEKLAEAEKKRKQADKIDRALLDKKVVGEDQIKKQSTLRDVLRAEADKIEKENGLTEKELTPSKAVWFKNNSEEKIKETEDLLDEERKKENGGDPAKVKEYEEKIDGLRQNIGNADYIIAQSAKLPELEKQLVEAEKNKDAQSANNIRQIILGVEGNIGRFKADLPSTKAFLEEQHKEQARAFLDNKAVNIFGFTKAHWENKATAARNLASTYSEQGDEKKAEEYSKLSNSFSKRAKLTGVATATAGFGLLGVSGLAGGAVLGAKAGKWFSNTSKSQGQKLVHLGKDAQFAEIRKEMKELEDLDSHELSKLTKNENIPKTQRVAAILEYLRQGQDGADNIENNRLLLNQLGADHKTKEYLEKLIQEQFPNFAHLKHDIPLSRQIELNIIDVKKIDSSVYKARRGEMAWETVLNLKFAAVMDMSKRSKAVEDNILAGLEMKFQDLKASGAFDDASQWGDLGKVLTRYFAVGKKDAKFEEIFMNDKGEIQHLGLLKSMSQNKDFQNVVAYTRFDKIMDKLPEAARNEFMGNVILKSHTGEIIPALTEAAANGDAPSQESAQRLIDYIADIKKDESGTKEKVAIEAGLRGFTKGTKAYEDEEKKLKENFNQLWKSLRESSVARSGRMKDLFDWRNVPHPDKITKQAEEAEMNG